MHLYSFTEQEYNTALFSGLTEKQGSKLMKKSSRILW